MSGERGGGSNKISIEFAAHQTSPHNMKSPHRNTYTQVVILVKHNYCFRRCLDNQSKLTMETKYSLTVIPETNVSFAQS